MNSFFDLILPKFCLNCGQPGAYLCQPCCRLVSAYSTTFCPECGRAAINGATHPSCLKKDSLDGIICLFDYKDPLKKVLHKLKYNFGYQVKEVFDSLFEKIDLAGKFTDYSLLALPLEASRENWRGFNQAEVVGQLLTKRFGWKTQGTSPLQRKHFIRQQTGLSLKDREKNLAGAFQVAEGTDLTGAKLIIFDDVWTTGTSLREATKVLKKAGASQVWGLCLASSHNVS